MSNTKLIVSEQEIKNHHARLLRSKREKAKSLQHNKIIKDTYVFALVIVGYVALVFYSLEKAGYL